MRTKIKAILQKTDFETLIDTKATVAGWVKTLRQQKNFSFVELNDGSCFSSLQIIINDTHPQY